jgi:hypothetical protein
MCLGPRFFVTVERLGDRHRTRPSGVDATRWSGASKAGSEALCESFARFRGSQIRRTACKKLLEWVAAAVAGPVAAGPLVGGSRETFATVWGDSDPASGVCGRPNAEGMSGRCVATLSRRVEPGATVDRLLALPGRGPALRELADLPSDVYLRWQRSRRSGVTSAIDRAHSARNRRAGSPTATCTR